jgi:hypothetical protein
VRLHEPGLFFACLTAAFARPLKADRQFCADIVTNVTKAKPEVFVSLENQPAVGVL